MFEKFFRQIGFRSIRLSLTLSRVRLIIFILLGLFVILNLWLFLILGSLRTFYWNYPQIFGLTSLNQNYLILFQNDAELRPTGGFITSFARLRFTLGVPTRLSIANSYSIDHTSQFQVEAPAPIKAIFSGDRAFRGWMFRDANFSPDYPTSVEDILRFYRYTDDLEFDGVIAIDTQLLGDWLSIFSPLRVQGLDFTPQNLFSRLEFAVKNIDKHDEEALANRKGIISSFAKKLIFWSFVTPWNQSRIFGVIAQGLKSKHILVWMRDPDLQKKLERLGYAGLWREEPGVLSLGASFANLGGKKSDRYIRREVEYDLDLQADGSIEGRARVKLIHTGEENYQSGLYRGYLRIYLPPSAELTNFRGDFGREGVETNSELGFRALGSFYSVEPGTEAIFKYYFRIPAGKYGREDLKIKILKQAGTNSDFYRLTLRTPSGTWISGDGFELRENRAFAEMFLDTDAEFSVRISEDRESPIVVDQRMDGDLSRVLVIFSEEMDLDSVSNIENYQIVDRDYRHRKISDWVRVVRAEYQDRGVTLSIEGMTEQEDERYYLYLKNLKDKSGNPLVPDPHRVTLVQRIE